LLVAVPVGVLRVLLEPPDVLEAELRHRDQVVVLVLRPALGSGGRGHRASLLASVMPRSFPLPGPATRLRIAAVQRLQAGEGARPGALAGEVDPARARGVVRPDRVDATARVERDRDRVGQAPVRVRDGGTEDAE